MIRRFFVVMALLVSAANFAQEGSASPYSYFGLGDQRFKGVIENRSMGGISVFSDSIHVNLKNPAALSGLRLTTYVAGGSYTSLNLKSETASESTSNITFDYLALGLPLSKKGGLSFGFMPYRSVGYNLEILDEDSDPSVLRRFEGDGGLNRVFLSVGFQITKNFSVGATGNYDFGRIENKTLQVIEGVQLATRELNQSDLSGLDVNLALQYKGSIKDKWTLYSTFLYTPETTLTSENSREISTLIISGSGNEVPRETVEIDLEALGLAKTDVTLPSSYTLGLGFGEDRKWFVGGEFEIKKTSKFDNQFASGNNSSYEDGERFSAGAFFIPDYDSFTSYWKRVVYRVGLHNERTGLKVNNVPVHDFGMSFGLGLPLGTYVPTTNVNQQFAGMFSNINVGFEMGKRGSTYLGRIEENYFNVTIGLSLNDRWFQKRKYD